MVEDGYAVSHHDPEAASPTEEPTMTLVITIVLAVVVLFALVAMRRRRT
jgi:hypothetical protein